jgi:aspartate/tyrosine/aromatic aminotransferase
MRTQWQSELTALRDELAHRRRVMAATLRSKQEEEDLKVGAWGTGREEGH